MTPDKLVVRTAVLAAPGKLEFRTDELATGGLGPRDIVAVTRTSVISPGRIGWPPPRSAALPSPSAMATNPAF